MHITLNYSYFQMLLILLASGQGNLHQHLQHPLHSASTVTQPVPYRFNITLYSKSNYSERTGHNTNRTNLYIKYNTNRTNLYTQHNTNRTNRNTHNNTNRDNLNGQQNTNLTTQNIPQNVIFSFSNNTSINNQNITAGVNDTINTEIVNSHYGVFHIDNNLSNGKEKHENTENQTSHRNLFQQDSEELIFNEYNNHTLQIVEQTNKNQIDFHNSSTNDEINKYVNDSKQINLLGLREPLSPNSPPSAQQTDTDTYLTLSNSHPYKSHYPSVKLLPTTPHPPASAAKQMVATHISSAAHRGMHLNAAERQPRPSSKDMFPAESAPGLVVTQEDHGWARHSPPVATHAGYGWARRSPPVSTHGGHGWALQSPMVRVQNYFS